MKPSAVSRYALSSCAVAAMLGGCGGSRPPIGAPGAMPQSLLQHANAPMHDVSALELTRFRGVFPPCGERPHHGQETRLSPGVPG
jgi:hypothetical protein